MLANSLFVDNTELTQTFSFPQHLITDSSEGKYYSLEEFVEKEQVMEYAHLFSITDSAFVGYTSDYFQNSDQSSYVDPTTNPDLSGLDL